MFMRYHHNKFHIRFTLHIWKASTQITAAVELKFFRRWLPFNVF